MFRLALPIVRYGGRYPDVNRDDPLPVKYNFWGDS